MMLMLRIAPDMQLLVIPPPISSNSQKSGLGLCLITEEPPSTKKKKNKQSTQPYIQIKNTQINKNRLNTLKTGSPVKSPFFCSGENLISKPWDWLESIFRFEIATALYFFKGKGKRTKNPKSFVFKTRKRTQVRVLII